MYTLRQYFFAWPLVFVSLVWSLPGQWQVNDCPEQCTCVLESIYKKVYCDIQNKQQLKAIPTRFPADAQYITLKGNQISTIPGGAFLYLRELRYLNLASNKLESLPENVFQNLTSLESLNLSKNRLGQLPSGLLHGLNSLRDLYLDGNVLENLPKDFFQGLTSLRRLYLDNNKFYTLSHNWFGYRGAKMNNEESETPMPTIISNLTSLVELLLNHNGIARVRYDSFNKMSDLRRLKLNNNNITTLPRGIFRDLKSLRLLSLYKNPFQCTCSLKWLKHWIVQNRKYVTVFYPHLIKCNGPSNLYGKSLLQVKDSEFGCKENQWAEWSNWGSCSKPCNYGIQTRTRKCPAGPRLCHGTNIDSRWCNTQRCIPKWSAWSVWTPCSVTCSVGYQTRSRSTQCTQSPCQRQLESEVRACPRKACPSYTEWSSWSICDAVCGQGTQNRKRECTTSHQGIPCPGTKVETQDCKIRDCAEWAEWGIWSACSKSCSRGEQTRRRDCVIVHGIKQECPGRNIDIQECSIKPCPVDGGWSSWLPWSSCSKTCGLGLSTRYRTCSNPYPKHGGAECKGSHFEFTRCVNGLCTDDTTEFTPWSDWSQCSTQCGKGFKSRHRICRKQDPITGIHMCLGNAEQYQYCEGNKCVGMWGEWTHWSECIGDCKLGQTFRLRFCVNDQGRVGYICINNKTFDIQKKSCKPTSCSYKKPVWSSWTAWSGCSRSCAGGTRRRWRYCLTNIIGKPCPGNNEGKQSCNVHPCPIHGGWSSWSEWGECDKSCDGGIKQRFRTCTKPKPKYNGQECIGDAKNKTICNTHRCKANLMINDGTLNEGKAEVKRPEKEEVFLSKMPQCRIPKMPKNGKHFIKKQKDAHTFLEYRCDDYYRNRGDSVIRYCMNDGTWSGHPADCVPDCGEIKDVLPEKRKERITSIRNLNDFWPWQVAIEIPTKGIHCGGSLIADQWVLTAAHCVLEPRFLKHFKEIKVILGTYNLTDKSSKNVQVILVNKTIHHTDFDWDLVESDIAILKLERKVHITKYVHPVCLPKKKRNRRKKIDVGDTGVFIGWGSTQEPNLLRQIPLPVVRLEECKQSYEMNRYNVSYKMLCAGYKNKRHGLCNKDSGGGFVFLDKHRKNRWVLRGIASWRYPKCEKMGKYSVFTDVTKHTKWILDMMKTS